MDDDYSLGVGAPLPSRAADGSWNRTELDSNDKLRRQLLGKNYKKIMSERSAAAGRQPSNMKSLSGASSATNQSQTTAGRAGDDDDEDEGRTASVGKKGPTKKRKAESIPRSLDYIVTDNDDRGDRVDGGGDGEVETLVKQGESLSQQPSRLRGRRKATSFLDEILAERSRKRKKK